jgi:hypothetical protein
VIEHRLFKRFTIGEPDGSTSDRILALRDALVSAGFDAPIRDTIRWNIRLKLWGNVCFNPVSALTLATLDRVTSEPGLRAICISMMAIARTLEREERTVTMEHASYGQSKLMVPSSSLSFGMTLVMAIACGVAAANIYYNQPMLGIMESAFPAQAAVIGLLPTASQLGFAVGLLLPPKDNISAYIILKGPRYED